MKFRNPLRKSFACVYCRKIFTMTHFEISKVKCCPFCGREGIVEIDLNKLL